MILVEVFDPTVSGSLRALISLQAISLPLPNVGQLWYCMQLFLWVPFARGDWPSISRV